MAVPSARTSSGRTLDSSCSTRRCRSALRRLVRRCKGSPWVITDGRGDTIDVVGAMQYNGEQNLLSVGVTCDTTGFNLHHASDGVYAVPKDAIDVT